MAYKIAFGALKGGVGKSTCTCATAAVISKFSSRRTLVIDADEQRNTQRYLDGCVEAGLLDTVDTEQVNGPKGLTRLEADTGHLFTLIDLPGHVRARELKGTLNGREDQPLCDLLVVPCGPSEFDLESVVSFVEEVVEPAGTPYGVVITKVPPRSLAESMELQRQLQADGVEVFSTLVREYRGVRDAQRDRKPITGYRGQHNTVRLAEDDFRSLTREILKKVGSHVRIPTRADETRGTA